MKYELLAIVIAIVPGFTQHFGAGQQPCDFGSWWHEPDSQILTSDINGDCTVDALDWLELNRCWGPILGPCDPCCRSDLDKSGTVDALDFLKLNADFARVIEYGF